MTRSYAEEVEDGKEAVRPGFMLARCGSSEGKTGEEGEERTAEVPSQEKNCPLKECLVECQEQVCVPRKHSLSVSRDTCKAHLQVTVLSKKTATLY